MIRVEQDDAMGSALLDLDAALGGRPRLLIGGGYGLYLKQVHLQSERTRTLVPGEQWPSARTTEDIDLFLRADVFADESSIRRIREALDETGFRVVEDAKWMKFFRAAQGTKVVLDVMTGPIYEGTSAVTVRGVRVRHPTASGVLHGRYTADALGIEVDPIEIWLAGLTTSGEEHECTVRVPQAFPMLVMKLCAFKDQVNDESKDAGRRHAFDLVRIVAMLTKSEEERARELVVRFASNPELQKARSVIDDSFRPNDGLGRIRIREHALYRRNQDLDGLAREMSRLLGQSAIAEGLI